MGRLTELRRPVHIGLSARIFHPESGASGLRTKTLQVLEQSVAQWVMARDVLVLMVPTVLKDGDLLRSSIRLGDYADYLDGLILQGGADISPGAYGEKPLRPEWSGDPVRDAYELELIHEFMSVGKPVLGICRGMQLINVALGGTLFQDIHTQYPKAAVHESLTFDRNSHWVDFAPEGKFVQWFDNRPDGRVVSIHHQAINRLGDNLAVEAHSRLDRVIEAIRWEGRSFVCGVQWHPEFHYQPGSEELLDCMPLIDAFLAAARQAR